MKALAVAAALALAACRPPPAPPAVIGNRPEPPTVAAGPITTAGLADLLGERFAAQVAAGSFVTEWNGAEEAVLAELAAMGWTDLGEVAAAIPPDLGTRGAVQFTVDKPANLPGTLRDVMILHDARRYFRDAWNHHWASLAPGDLQVYRAYGIDLAPLHAAGVTRDDGS